MVYMNETTLRALSDGVHYMAFRGVELPTGGSDDIPVIIIKGKNEGACLWVTGSIHGNEYSGMSVIHRLMGINAVNFDTDAMNGSLVLVPTLNPSGLRVNRREPYYTQSLVYADPNRAFPETIFNQYTFASNNVERLYKDVYKAIVASADALIDIHNATIGSLPFSLLDPIYYHGNDVDEANDLLERTIKIMQVFGMPIVNEYESGSYLSQGLHRSVSGSVLNGGRIPAFTVELGGYDYIEAKLRDYAVAGVRNVMRNLGIIDSDYEKVPTFAPILDFEVVRTSSPVTPISGIAQYLVDAGDIIREGQPLCVMTDIMGRAKEVLKSSHDGYVIGQLGGNVFYEGDAVLLLAIKSNASKVHPVTYLD